MTETSATKSPGTIALLSALFSVLLFLPASYAQDINYIQNSGKYYYGIASGPNHHIARNNALAHLSESISVQIMSEFEQVVRETNSDLEQYAQGIVKTYSNTRLNRYEQRILSQTDESIEILVFIEKSAVERLFQDVEKMIHDFIRLAEKAETDLRIDDVLRYYYWAYLLSRSHPDNTKLRHTFSDGSNLPLMLAISDRIKQTFATLRFQVQNIETIKNPAQKLININITYKGKPIQRLDYTYFTGDGISAQHTAANGMAVAILDGGAASGMQSLRLDVEYQYINQARSTPEVQHLLENIDIPYFPTARFIINIGNHTLVVPESTKASMTMVLDRHQNELSPEQTVEMVVEAITQSNHQAVRNLFTDEGWDIYRKLITSGKVTILHQQRESLRTIQVNDEVMVRTVPMLFAYNTSRQSFIENVVFSFNSEGLINNMSYALSDLAINDILAKPENFGREEDKYFLIKFMEDFKTAYALKRLDFLDAIFDENALIIIGNIVKRTDEPVEKVQGMYGSLTREQVDYIRLSKSEYINRLRTVFNRNEFINIRFEDNEVRKTQKDDKIYGIQIAQNYFSSTYADKGYLFLMIDLNDSVNPRIYVRTWQPNKNDDGSIYGLEDFRF